MTDRYDYDAFGNLTFQSGNTENAYRYSGEQYDSDLGLYYNRARYLNTDSGRFWSMDDVEGRLDVPLSLHKYLYAHANPVLFRDRSGNSVTEEMGFGRRVHEEIAEHFIETSPGPYRYAEKYISTVAKGKPRTGALKRIYDTILGQRVDLIDMNGDGKTVPFYLFEIKPYTEAAEGLVQLSAYVFFATMMADGNFEFDFGTPSVYTPPTTMVIDGKAVLIAPPVAGVIVYMVPESEAKKALVGVGILATFKALQQISYMSSVGGMQGIQARLALSGAMRGL